MLSILMNNWLERFFDFCTDYIGVLFMGLQIGMFIGGFYHLLVTGSWETTIFFWFVAILLTFLY